MKKILITGVHSYIGKSLAEYLREEYQDSYVVDSISLRDPSWRENTYSSYDAVFHVAGIAHSDIRKVTEERKSQYYRVNTELTLETAEKMKRDGVRQFIYMSSAIVYGDSAPVGKRKIITKDTPVSPANFYGDSKARAEEGLLKLADDGFKVAIIRSPMVYGKGSKGNWPQLSKMACKVPVVPYVDNERSMLYIGNLVEFVRLLVENVDGGIFWPQNGQYSNTCELMRLIAQVHGKHQFQIRGFGWVLKVLSLFTGLVNKAFGSMSFEPGLSEYKQEYQLYSLEESIKRTESEHEDDMDH